MQSDTDKFFFLETYLKKSTTNKLDDEQADSTRVFRPVVSRLANKFILEERVTET